MYIRCLPVCLYYCVFVSADLLETPSLVLSVACSLISGISSPTASLFGNASGVFMIPYGLRW